MIIPEWAELERIDQKYRHKAAELDIFFADLMKMNNDLLQAFPDGEIETFCERFSIEYQSSKKMIELMIDLSEYLEGCIKSFQEQAEPFEVFLPY